MNPLIHDGAITFAFRDPSNQVVWNPGDFEFSTQIKIIASYTLSSHFATMPRLHVGSYQSLIHMLVGTYE
jgi:hypothetical protein